MSKEIVWWTPQMTGSELDFIKKVVDINYINDGEVTTRFENEISKRIGAKYAIAVTSGTIAIFLGLVSNGVGPGDEVILPDVTFIATANAVKLAGATPVLVDVDPKNLNISPEATRAAITSRTKAIVPVHVSGRAADMGAIMEIADEFDLKVVEDAAEGLMSAWRGNYLGTIGHAGCFSFSPNKSITTGQGGIVVTNNETVYGRLRELKDQGRPTKGTGGDDIHHSTGFNFKFTNLQAAVGLAQLTQLDHRLERQKQIYRIYSNELEGIPDIRLPGFDLNAGEIPQWTDAVIENRDALDRFLQKQQIHCRRFWHPIHTQTPYRQKDKFFPVSTRLMPKALWLPSAFTLSDDDIRLTCNTIHQFVES